MKRFLLLSGSLFLFIFLPAQPVKPPPQTILYYTFGRYTPLGIRTAVEYANGFGFYLEGRVNAASFIKNEYTMKNGKINDAAWIWNYSDKKKYGRTEIYGGFNFPVLPRTDALDLSGKYSLCLFTSAGILYARYLYLYERVYKGPTWVRDLQQGGVHFDLSAGFQGRIGKYRILLGCSGLLDKNEFMLMAGIGVPYLAGK